MHSRCPVLLIACFVLLCNVRMMNFAPLISSSDFAQLFQDTYNRPGKSMDKLNMESPFSCNDFVGKSVHSFIKIS